MHPISLVAIIRNLIFIILLALVAPSCGTAEHVAPNSLNIQENEADPHNSLYRHHDIMLEMRQQSDVFGLVEARPETVGDYQPLDQDPVKTEQATPVEAKLARAETPVRPTQKALPSEASSNRSLLAPAQLWRVRVFEPEQVKAPIVFDHAGIEPKIGAARPAVLEDKPKRSFRPMQKKLRKRALTRLNENGEAVRTHKKPGSVI